MSNLGRVLTLRVKVVDSEAADVIWESLRTGNPVIGCSLRALSDGDMFKKLAMMEERIEYLESMCEEEGITVKPAHIDLDA